MAGTGDRGKVIQGLVASLAQAADMEGWGLLVEAAEEYQRTARRMRTAAGGPGAGGFSGREKEFLIQTAQVLELKTSSLQEPSSVQEAGDSQQSVDVKKILTALQEMMRGGISESTLSDALPSANTDTAMRPPHTQAAVEDSRHIVAASNGGSLVPRLPTQSGHTYLTITVERIGVKDPHNYIDPFITVSLKTMSGADIVAPQDTPVTNKRDDSALLFGVAIDIPTPVNEFPHGSAIFLELKHYKPKKSCISTRCFSFMEMDEIKEGRAVLEIYKKPTDYHRKKLSLLSAKPLYLHLTLSLHRA